MCAVPTVGCNGRLRHSVPQAPKHTFTCLAGGLLSSLILVVVISLMGNAVVSRLVISDPPPPPPASHPRSFQASLQNVGLVVIVEV